MNYWRYALSIGAWVLHSRTMAGSPSIFKQGDDMETYQAIYDAVRSRIGEFNSDRLIDTISMNFDISHHMEILRSEFITVAYEMQRPSVLLKPKIYMDGDKWCVLYGENIQDGIAGFGASPQEAFNNFDEIYYKKL